LRPRPGRASHKEQQSGTDSTSGISQSSFSSKLTANG
jgi:hypothetical protein